jgi:hypothetical protein
MRTSTKRTIVAMFAGAVAVTALGVAGAQGATADNPKGQNSHATADSSFLTKERAASRNVVTTKASVAALASVQSRIASYVAKNGTKYTFGSYADPATGNVVVNTNAPRSLVTSLTSLSGNKAFAGVKLSLKSGTISDNYSRKDDIPAFYGGGGITSGGGICSDGYAVQDSSGYRYMVTAGHCFANGAAVNTESNARSEGYVTGRQLASLGNGPVDMELLYSQSYWGRIFTGGVDDAVNLPVVGAGDASVGYNAYCFSGRTSGESCGHTNVSNTAQVCTQTGCKSPVIAFTGGQLPQGGDSGSPFYAKTTTQTWIRGHILASGGGTGYAEPFTQTQARYGISIVTG